MNKSQNIAGSSFLQLVSILNHHKLNIFGLMDL